MVDLSYIMEKITGIAHTHDGPYLVCAEPGGEPYIAHWDESVLGPQPTEEQVAVVGLAVAQAQAVAAATAACDAVLAPLGVEYGRWETATWDQQYAEAVALMADPALEAVPVSQAEDKIPMLRSLTISRSTPDRTWTIPEMAQRIIRNRETWSVLTGNVVGQRLAIVDRINAATTVAEVQAVDVTIRLPG